MHSNLIEELQKRARLWYGQEPTTLLKALPKLERLPHLPDKTILIEPIDNRPYYVYYNNSFYCNDTVQFKQALLEKDGVYDRVRMFPFMINKLMTSLNDLSN